MSFKSKLKKKARPIAGALYRVVVPILRPVAFRMRAYFTAPLLEQSRQHQEEILCSIRLQVETTIGQVLTTHTLQTVQEIQSTRAFLRQQIASLGPIGLTEQLARIEQYAYTAVRRVAVPTGPDEILVRTVLGYVLCPASDHALICSLMEGGELEPGTRLLIQRLLTPGDTFVDVGANIGMHTLAAGFALEGQGRIVSFEPFSKTFGLLRKTIWMNGFSAISETHQAAASNRNGRQTLFLGATSGHHSLYRSEDGGGAPEQSTAEVTLVRVDDVFQVNPRVDVMKIDVEGAEVDVLEGASATIAGNQDIGLIVEFDFEQVKRSHRSTEEWLRAFKSLGLDFGVIDGQSGELNKWTPQQLEDHPTVNLFFSRPDSRAWRRAWRTE